MARPLRIEYPGAVCHVTCRGNAGNEIFGDDPDRETFLSTLGTVIKRYNWLYYAYYLMNNEVFTSSISANSRASQKFALIACRSS